MARLKFTFNIIFKNNVDAEVLRKHFGKEILTAPWEGVSSLL
jgi:hypothetical protein